jgi:hypothetical protein
MPFDADQQLHQEAFNPLTLAIKVTIVPGPSIDSPEDKLSEGQIARLEWDPATHSFRVVIV